MDSEREASSSKFEVSDELFSSIAKTLGVKRGKRRLLLRERLDRYGSRYRNCLARQNIVLPVGVVRKQLESIARYGKKLQAALDPLLATSDDLRRGYAYLNRGKPKTDRTSLARFREELDAILFLAHTAAQKRALKRALKRGPKHQRCLHFAIGSFISLFERLTGGRPTISDSKNSVKVMNLRGPEADALKKVFAELDPKVSEPSLAYHVQLMSAEYDRRRLREGDFDIISNFEDHGIEVERRTYLGPIPTK